MCGEAMGMTFAPDATPEEIGKQIREYLVDFVYNVCKMPSMKDVYTFDESKFDECADACSKEFFQTFNPRKMNQGRLPQDHGQPAGHLIQSRYPHWRCSAGARMIDPFQINPIERAQQADC